MVGGFGWNGAAVLFALWSLVAGATCCCLRFELGCWCRCNLLLQGAAVRVSLALWSLVAGAAAGCRFRKKRLNAVSIFFC